MATCAVAVQQADGSYLLSLDPSVTDVTTCSYVVQSGADLGNSLLTMSVTDGLLISGAMVGVWGAAWCVTAIVRVIRGNQNEAE